MSNIETKRDLAHLSSRREFLARAGCAGALGAAAFMLNGCESLEQRFTHPDLPSTLFPASMIGSAGAAQEEVNPAMRVMNRLAYGPRPGDMSYIDKVGVPAYIERQLSPDTIDEEPTLMWRVRSLGDTLNADPGLLFDIDDHVVVGALRQATLLRAMYSRRQLYERTVGFWTDHFNIYAFKGQGPQLKVVDDRQSVRKHALGRFRDLLGASARSAAMLGYLDNTVNRRGAPNENYARELMELHTLGVHGGYTQRDVHEVARCLTGWTAQAHWHRGEFSFNSAAHDNGSKVVLGTTIPAGGGIEDGERVLDLLAAHPATATHLANKLCTHFLGQTPPALAGRMARTYERTSGNMRAVMRELVLSDELITSPPILKRPLDYLVSAARAFDTDTDAGPALHSHLEAMGQPLFGWPMPNGYPEAAESWVGGLTPRWNYALALMGGQIANTKIDWDSLTDAGLRQSVDSRSTILDLTIGRSNGPAAGKILAAAGTELGIADFAALTLMSPAFQWR